MRYREIHSSPSSLCPVKQKQYCEERNNKQEINLLWLGTRRANFSLSGFLLVLLSFRISVTRLCLLLHSLVGRGKGSSVQVLQNAWPADRNAWITKLADKSCCPLPLPLLKLPMTKFFLARDFKLERHSTRGGLVNSFSMASTSARAL